jgi:transposase
LLTFGDDFSTSYPHIKEMHFLIQQLLALPDLRFDAWRVETTQTQLVLQLTSLQPTPSCPGCHQPAARLHSRYQRTLTDLPWSGYGLQIQLSVRKLFCDNVACSRRIFTERLPDLAEPWARRTNRLAERLTSIGLASGGAPGARLSGHFGIPASRHTLLRLVRRQPLPIGPPPAVLGVDDWAHRKRQIYGTILVDLEQSRPVALLADREADTLAGWLRTHPGVKMVARDRSIAYAEGIRAGAPQAIQMTDRFHLLQNLSEALDQVFSAHGSALTEVKKQLKSESSIRAGTVTVPSTRLPPLASQRAEQRRARRLALYTRVWELHRHGWSDRVIARQLGIGRMTVTRYLQAPVFPERKERSDQGRSVLDPYKAYLVERWNAGQRETLSLFRAIRSQGYGGSYATVARYTHRLREAQGLKPRQRPAGRLPKVTQNRHRALTTRRATRLVLQRPEQRTEEDERLILQLKAQHAELAAAIELAREFAAMVRQRQPDRFDHWLMGVAQSVCPALQRFAKGLRDDYDAVKTSLILPWSNGPVEGHINRLKTLKRSMYGRAGLDLLTRRFLLAA